MLKRFFILSCLLFVTGCANTPPGGFACPETGLMRDADTVTVFQSGVPSSDKNDILSRVIMDTFKGGCRFDKKTNTALIEFELRFYGERGPAGIALAEQRLHYFVAILGPDDTLLSRRSFPIKIAFTANGAGEAHEKLRQKIPLGNAQQAKSYKIVFGFELSPEEVDYNKNRHRP